MDIVEFPLVPVVATVCATKDFVENYGSPSPVICLSVFYFSYSTFFSVFH